MITNIASVHLSVVLQGLTDRGVEVQMMQMPVMWDMWIWLILIATILVVAVTLAVYLSTRPRQAAPSTLSHTPPSQHTQPAQTTTSAVEAPQSMSVTEVAEPVTKTIQLRKALEIVRPTINDDERRVLNEIVKAGGEILQSDLPEKTDFSKATVSKLIKSLETMGIVAREKHKWTYWVRISDKLISRTKNT